MVKSNAYHKNTRTNSLSMLKIYHYSHRKAVLRCITSAFES